MNPRTPVVVGAVVLSGLAVAGALAYTARWQLIAYSALPLLSCTLGIVLALVALVTLQREQAKPSPSLNRLGKRMLLTSLFLVLQLVVYPVALAWRNQEVHQAQAFIEGLIPQLEDYYRQHSAYPEDVNSVLATGVGLPALLQLSDAFPLAYNNHDFYVYRETTYAFRFYVPDGFIGFRYDYCCGANGVWTVTD